MKITDVKVHHVEWDRSPYYWHDEIITSGKMAQPAMLRNPVGGTGFGL